MVVAAFLLLWLFSENAHLFQQFNSLACWYAFRCVYDNAVYNVQFDFFLFACLFSLRFPNFARFSLFPFYFWGAGYTFRCIMKWKSIQQQSLLFFISFCVEWQNLKALWCCCIPNVVKHKAIPLNVLKYRTLYVSSLYICNIHITNQINGPPLCFQLIQSFEDALLFDLIEWTVAVQSNYRINYEFFFLHLHCKRRSNWI